MADNVQFTVGADSTPPGGTLAATDELADGSHAGIAKLAISADGDRTLIPATAADGLLVDVSNASIPVTGGLTDAELRASPVDVEVAAALPAGTNNIGDVDVASLPDEGQQTMANSISVAVASDQTPIPVSEERSSTAAQSSVADSASSQTLIAANASRIKVLITNDSSARLYIRFEAAAASLTAYGVSLAQYEAWEELNYTGEIRGIWATDPGDGAARITEFT